MVHNQIARVTHGLSPASIIGAYMDLLAHLAVAPGKQQELVTKSVCKSARIALHAMRCGMDSGATCIDPLPQDRRFAAPQWQQWPYNLIYQSFLLNQQWWHNATSGVRGVTAHHEHVTTFMTRQWLDMFSPSNFLLTNPEVLAETARTGGANLVRGMQNWARDAMQQFTNQPSADTQSFRPGQQLPQRGDESGIVFRQRSRHAHVARPQRRVVERLDQDVARPQVRRQLAGIVRREVGEEEIGLSGIGAHA
jgi:polyhydroxyalkanoate synthase